MKAFSIAILGIAALVACADRVTTSLSPTNSLSPSDSSYILSDIQLTQSSYDAQRQRVICNFINRDSGRSVFAGTLTVNGTVVPARYLSGSPGTVYWGYADSGTAPITFDGSWQRVTTSGSSGYPPFADSIRSPVGITRISSPSSNDSVSKSAGFTVSWNPAIYGGVDIMLADTAWDNPGPLVDTLMKPDPGSVFIPAAKLTALHLGRLTFVVTRGDVKHGIPGQHARYRLGVGSSDERFVTLVP